MNTVLWELMYLIKMKTKLLIIIIGIISLVVTSAFILNYYIDEEIKTKKFDKEQIDRIFERCDYQKMMDDRNWMGLDGNKIADHQPLYVWNNSTHRLDNNICDWITIEKYEYDANLRNALDRCWIGNSQFLDEGFVLWNNQTHYIDTDTCLITEAMNKKNVSLSDLEKLLIQNDIDYLSDKLVVTSGPTTGGDPGCGAAIDVDSTTHWFGIDSISEPKEITLFSENPHQCEVNTSSCFCNAQMELSSLTLDELNYFTLEEQEKFANILIDYLSEENINKTPKFQIGKLNINYTDSSAIGYCGEIWGNNTYGFFDGAIVNDVVMDYGISKELPLLCAISDDVKWWERK